MNNDTDGAQGGAPIQSMGDGAGQPEQAQPTQEIVLEQPGQPEGVQGQPEQMTQEQPEPSADGQGQQQFQPQQNVKPDYAMPLAPKKENGWIKFLRVLIWFGVILLLTIGAGLTAASTKVASFVDGSSMALAKNGDILFKVGAVVGTLNFIWGAVRWFMRWGREKWKIGKVIGKLIGGGIWRTFAVAPIIAISLLFVAPAVAKNISEKVVSDSAAEQDTSISKLMEDFQSGEIDVNKYVEYLIDAAYNNTALPEKYKDETKFFADQVLDEVEKNLESLNADTLEKVLEMVTFSNIDFDTDASGNASVKNSPFVENVYAESKKVQTLNKVIASDNNHFIVFYTDTGSDAISADDAKRVGNIMEEALSGYKSVFGLDYHTNQQNFHEGAFASKKTKMKNLMDANGISKDLIDSAMPVYVINPYSAPSSTLASYVGERWLDIKERAITLLAQVLTDGETKETVDLYTSSPVLPFVNILPSNINDPSLALVTTHELGHHYASNYCYDTYGKKCGSDDHFVGETFPQIAATLIMTNAAEDNFMTHWHERYVTNSNLPLYDDYLDGYASFGFLYQYIQGVSDGKKKILDALMQDDAYWYLYEQAGQIKAKEVLGNLAVDNVLNNYGSLNALKSSKLPTGETLPCYDMCDVKYDGDESAYSWQSSTLHYFYFPLSEFKEKIAKITDMDGGRSYVFRFLGLKGGKWNEIKSVSKSEGNYEVKFDDFKDYDTILVAVADAEAADDTGRGFYIAINDAELEEEMLESETEDNEMSAFFGTYGNCLWFYTDGLLDAASELAGVFSGIDNDLDQAISEFQHDADEAKAEVGHRKVTLCGVYLDKNANFDKVKNRVMKTGGWFAIAPFDIIDGNSRAALTINYNPFANRVIARWIVKDNGEFAMITATIE